MVFAETGDPGQGFKVRLFLEVLIQILNHLFDTLIVIHIISIR